MVNMLKKEFLELMRSSLLHEIQFPLSNRSWSHVPTEFEELSTSLVDMLNREPSYRL